MREELDLEAALKRVAMWPDVHHPVPVSSADGKILAAAVTRLRAALAEKEKECGSLRSAENKAWARATVADESARKSNHKSQMDLEWAKTMRQSYEDELAAKDILLAEQAAKLKALGGSHGYQPRAQARTGESMTDKEKIAALEAELSKLMSHYNDGGSGSTYPKCWIERVLAEEQAERKKAEYRCADLEARLRYVLQECGCDEGLWRKKAESAEREAQGLREKWHDDTERMNGLLATIAAKDRLLAEQAAVIERARAAATKIVRETFHDYRQLACGEKDCRDRICVEQIKRYRTDEKSILDVVNAIPAPKPEQENI